MIDLGIYTDITNYYPYDTAMITGAVLTLHGGFVSGFHKDMAARAGRPHPDNKEVYVLSSENGGSLYVMFYDGRMMIGSEVSVR